MNRKRWTPKSEITENLLKSREKRKWQVAFRRYVLEKNLSPSYAYYFGLTIDQFRKWIEIQFIEGLSWENFGSAWHFDHIVPVAYFDFANEEDCLLCWNFINIRVKLLNKDKKGTDSIDLMAAKSYFKRLYDRTKFFLCLKMIAKINTIEATNFVDEPAIDDFIIKNIKQLEIVNSFTKEEFNSLNSGMSFKDILLEREIIKKFGSSTIV